MWNIVSFDARSSDEMIFVAEASFPWYVAAASC
jgi:hypothetical protein